MEIQKEILDGVLLNREGQPFMFDGGRGPVTPRKAFEFALELVAPGATKESSLEIAELIDRVFSSGSNFHLTAEDVAQIKKNAVLVFRPTLFRQLHDILEPPASPVVPETTESVDQTPSPFSADPGTAE